MGINNHNSELLINDILLSIPPTDIHITKDSLNNQWQTLRTNNSQKTKSGHSTVTIEFTLAFIGNDVQNKLQPLVAELRYMPFAFVENQFIRQNLFPQESESGFDDIDVTSIVLAMRSINITIDNEEQDVIWATFQFAYFNYFPYMPYWQYKKELFGDDASKTVAFPSQSNAWKQFVRAPINDGKALSGIADGKAKISFLELRTGPVASTDELEKTKEILNNISSNQKSFFDNLRNNPSDTLDKTFIDALHNTFPEYKPINSINSGDLIERLLLNASPRSNPNSSLYRSDNQYIDQNDLKQTINQIDQRILAKQKFNDTNNNIPERAFELIESLQANDNRGKGFGVFKRERGLDIDADNGFVITGINISIQNILATIPIAGHKYATFQHIGSIDAVVALDIKVLTDEASRNLSWFYDTVNDNMIANRHIPQGLQTVKLNNAFLSLFNLKEFITQDLRIDTVPQQPGTYNAKLSLMESGLQQKDKIDIPSDNKFHLEFAASDERVIREIIRTLNKFVIIKQSGNLVYFESSIIDNKSSRLAALVTEYIGKQGYLFKNNKLVRNPSNQQTPFFSLDTLLGRNGPSKEDQDAWFLGKNDTSPEAQFKNSDFIETPTALSEFAFNAYKLATADNGLLYETLFALTEEDVPGITKVQELVNFKTKTDRNVSSSVININNKPYSQLLSDARNNVVSANKLIGLQQTKVLYERLNFGDSNTRIKVPVIQNNTPTVTPYGVPSSVVFSQQDTRTTTENNINKQFKTSANNLTNSKSVIDWLNFISAFARSIINSDDINLPEFSTAKSMVKNLGLGNGLPAYNDFHLERVLDGTIHEGDMDKILSLDPDCFLYTPIETNIDDLVDPALIANAKQTARVSFDSAINEISKFYKWSWLPDFISDNIRDAIQNNISGTVNQHGSDDKIAAEHGGDPVSVYYRDNVEIGEFANAAAQNESPLHPEDLICIGGPSIDATSTRATATVSRIEKLRSYKGITHSLNPNDLFNIKDLNSGAINPVDPSVKSKFNNKSSNKKSKLGNPVTHATCGNGQYVPIQPAILAAQAGVDVETYSLARMISSEEGGAPDAYKIAVGWAIKNQANLANISVTRLLTRSHIGDGYYGAQDADRNASTRLDPYQIHIDIAQGIQDGSIQDTTGGATNFFAPKVQDDPGVRARITKQTKWSWEIIRDWTTGPRGRLDVVDVAGVDPFKLTFFKPKGQIGGRHIPTGNGSNRNTGPVSHVDTTSKQNKPSNDSFKTGPSPDTGLAAGLNVLDMSIDAFKKSLQNGQANRLVRAFPAFKLYFIQDDSGNRRRYGSDDFFSYNAVSEIKCVRSRKIPADLLEITVTNVSGTLSNRKFQTSRSINNTTNVDGSDKPLNSNGQPVKADPSGVLKKDSINENPISSLMLQAGMDVELNLGYSNDPAKLTTVFNGKIMEVEFSDSDDLIRIICQSHAIELVQDIKGTVEPIIKKGLFVNDARTDRLLEAMLAEPEIIHFGRYIRSKSIDGDTNHNRFLLTNKYTLEPQPQDDNIFTPPLSKLKELDPGWFLNDLKYNIYHTTIWDVFDEMTLRHPGWIKSAVPYKSRYGPRMTMFFGLPSQLYFSADPGIDELNAGAKLKTEIDKYNNDIKDTKTAMDKLRTASTVSTIDKAVKSIFGQSQSDTPLNLNKIGGLPFEVAVLTPERNFAAERLALARDYQSIKPFREYHLLTSKNHIISNNIRASAKNTYNTVSIQYGSSSWNKDTKELVQEGTDVLSLSIDAALPDEETRELFLSYKNCVSKLMARKYATASLIRELKDVYRGELTIIGNPNIKPYDVCMVMDDYNDISGPIEVEQVIHYFSQDTGFITEITPDLFVTANEWVNMTAMDMMSVVLQGTASSLNHSTPTTTEQLSQDVNPLYAAAGFIASPLTLIAGGAALAGSFIANKIVDFTSHGSPVVIHPLMYHGKPFIAGLPISKLNNLWLSDKGQWIKQGIDGFNLLFDDFNDKLTLATSQGSVLNLFSGNTIPPKF